MKCDNKRGFFYQWELNQRVIVTEDCSIVQFANGTLTNALGSEVKEEDGVRYAEVPNILLQTAANLHAYAWNEETTSVVGHSVFAVDPMPKPAEYAYTQTEVKQYDMLLAVLEERGAYYVPSVDAEGVLSWYKTIAQMPDVPEVNIRGPQGIQGVKGDKGDKGDQGEQGPQGEKGEKGDTGAQGIQGEKGDPGEVNIDDTKVGADAWSSKAIVDKLCQAFTESGPAVRCQPVAGYPLSIVADLPLDVVNFEKIHSKLTVFLRGKNLIPYPYAEATKTENGITFQDNGNGSITISGVASADTTFKLYSNSAGWNIPSGATIAFGGVADGTAGTYHYLVSGTNIQRTYGDHRKTETITEKMVIKTISIRVKEGFEFQEPLTIWPQIEVGEVSTTYEVFRGKSVELNFDEAVKGGTLDLDTGILIDPETYEEKKIFEPQAITALPGLNTVYCSAGTLTVTGRADLVAVIENLTNAIIAQGGNI